MRYTLTVTGDAEENCIKGPVEPVSFSHSIGRSLAIYGHFLMQFMA